MSKNMVLAKYSVANMLTDGTMAEPYTIVFELHIKGHYGICPKCHLNMAMYLNEPGRYDGIWVILFI